MHPLQYKILLSLLLSLSPMGAQPMAEVVPEPFGGALDNPLKGFRPDDPGRPFSPLLRWYVPWNEIEKAEGDSADRLVAWMNRQFAAHGTNLAARNIKVIPRVFLDWEGRLDRDGSPRQYWPEDMRAFDYDSPAFQKRLAALIAKMGRAWNGDPRVFSVQMGLIGFWGELHDPSPSAEVHALLIREFKKAFPDKPVQVRMPDEADAKAGFGVYYDTFATPIREAGGKWHHHGTHGDFPYRVLHGLGDLWRRGIVEGEVEYNWQNTLPESTPGENFGRSPDETLATPAYRRHMEAMIRRYHATTLGWIAEYDPTKPGVLSGAGELMKAFGYRFELRRFAWTPAVKEGRLDVAFTVRNTGSAPFYLDFPVALALLDPATRAVRWQTVLRNADVRRWMPGDEFDAPSFSYLKPAPEVRVEERVQVPAALAKGEYVVALAILDLQGGMLPSVRFATKAYFRGGWHPMGRLAIGGTPASTKVDGPFDDPTFDDSLHYIVPEALLRVTEPPIPPVAAKAATFQPDLRSNVLDPHRYWEVSRRSGTIRRTVAYPEGTAEPVHGLSGDFGEESALWHVPFNYDPLPPGIYRFACRMRSASETPVTLKFQDNWKTREEHPLPLTADWKELSVDFQIQEPLKDFLRTSLVGPKGGQGSFEFTGARLWKLDPPWPTWPPRSALKPMKSWGAIPLASGVPLGPCTLERVEDVMVRLNVARATEQFWQAGVNLRMGPAVEKDNAFTLTFQARTVTPDGNEGRMALVFMKATPPWTLAFQTNVAIPTAWTRFSFRFQSHIAYAAGDSKLGLILGSQAQVIEMKDMALERGN